MSDFRRQPSKVWWSTYENENLSMYSKVLGWGKGGDLGKTFAEGCHDDLHPFKVAANDSEDDDEKKSSTSGFLQKKHRVEDGKAEEEGRPGQDTKRKSLESDRGSSSSPSQGSHKSQDSGFSDSEIQNNCASPSPQCSPELIKARLNCIKYQTLDESTETTSNATSAASVPDYRDKSQKEKAYNEAVANYRKLKTSIKTATPKYQQAEFDSDVYKKPVKYLETAFDGYNGDDDEGNNNKEVVQSDSTLKCSVTKSGFLKQKTGRTKSEKINQIQNQLESSFKLPKKINLTQNLKISNLFHGKLLSHEDIKVQRKTNSSVLKPRAKSAENITPLKTFPNACGSGTTTSLRKTSSSSLDNEGFKIPKLPVERGANHLYDLTEISGLPISSSTPKSRKNGGKDSSGISTAAKVTEKKSATKTTFATVRKLKGLSERKLRGSKIFLESFNRCQSSGTYPGKVRIRPDVDSSIKHWIAELKGIYEAEVMTTLQSKSLAVDLTRQVTNMADTTSYTVRKLHQKTKIISLEFSRLCKQLMNKCEKHVATLLRSLIDHVTEFIHEYVQKQSLVKPNHQRMTDKSLNLESEKEKEEADQELITDFRKPEPETIETRAKTKEEQVLESCDHLRKLIFNNNKYDFEILEREVAILGEKFREVVDGLLEKHIQALVEVLEEPRTELALRTALSALTTLGLESNQLGVIASKCGGIRALLAVCLEARATAVRVSALRALATVCSVAETIRQFEQAGGVEIVADILADEKRSEAELSEAAAVVAQVTAPWVQDNNSVDGLNLFLSSLVKSLTRIVNEYATCETLLLSAAALANLTFMEPRTVWPLLENETAKVLLSAVRRQGSKVSVFIQEQVATIIANMSSVPECRKHLAEHRAVVALLCFLETPHSPLQSPPEVAAAERVLQKSAIALSRLCSDTVVAKQVVELQGATRLVRLCKEERERNHSDGVLVACLAALRKIVANCGTEALEELNAMELVEPRLLDSFLLYSSKQESYV